MRTRAADVMLDSAGSADTEVVSPLQRDEADRHVIDMAPRGHRSMQISKTAKFFSSFHHGSTQSGSASAASEDAGGGVRAAASDSALWAGERLHSVAVAAVEDVAEAVAEQRGGFGALPRSAVVEGLGGSCDVGRERGNTHDEEAFLDAKIDLSSAIQVWPPTLQMCGTVEDCMRSHVVRAHCSANRQIRTQRRRQQDRSKHAG